MIYNGVVCFTREGWRFFRGNSNEQPCEREFPRNVRAKKIVQIYIYRSSNVGAIRFAQRRYSDWLFSTMDILGKTDTRRIAGFIELRDSVLTRFTNLTNLTFFLYFSLPSLFIFSSFFLSFFFPCFLEKCVLQRLNDFYTVRLFVSYQRVRCIFVYSRSSYRKKPGQKWSGKARFIYAVARSIFLFFPPRNSFSLIHM